jgi:hypothetical protein
MFNLFDQDLTWEKNNIGKSNSHLMDNLKMHKTKEMEKKWILTLFLELDVR